MSHTGQRYKDVLLALVAANNYGQPIGRLQLQKFIYLADIMSVVCDLLSPKFGYQTYKNGPYDPGVQNAVDVLTFRGAVSIVEGELISRRKVVACYKISNVGLDIANRMKREISFKKRADLFDMIAYQVNRRGWEKLKNIVYSEATYLGQKNDGWGRPLETNSLLSNDTLRILTGFNSIVRDDKARLNKKNLVAIFFRLIDKYQAIFQST